MLAALAIFHSAAAEPESLGAPRGGVDLFRMLRHHPIHVAVVAMFFSANGSFAQRAPTTLFNFPQYRSALTESLGVQIGRTHQLRSEGQKEPRSEPKNHVRTIAVAVTTGVLVGGLAGYAIGRSKCRNVCDDAYPIFVPAIGGAVLGGVVGSGIAYLDIRDSRRRRSDNSTSTSGAGT